MNWPEHHDAPAATFSLLDTADDAPTQRSLLERLQYVADATLAHLTVNRLLDELLERICFVLQADTAAALLIDPTDQAFVVVAARGLDGLLQRHARVPDGKGLAGRIAAERRVIVIPDINHADIALPLLRARKVRSLLGAPLIVQGSMIGVIHVGTLQPRDFGADEAQLLQLVADRAALALDHARLYEAERKARLASEAALRARDEFLAIASHELKTPLTAIKSASQLLNRRLNQPEDDRRELVRLATTVESQILRLEKLVGDLLDVTRLEHGQVGILRQPLDLAALCAGVLDLLEFAPERGPDHELMLDIPEPLEGVWDGGRLERALINLVTNVFRYLPNGGEVGVRARPARNGAELVVTGRGRVDPATVRDQVPSSLMSGLYITAQTIEQHHGLINMNADLSGDIVTVAYTLWLPLAAPAVG